MVIEESSSSSNMYNITHQPVNPQSFVPPPPIPPTYNAQGNRRQYPPQYNYYNPQVPPKRKSSTPVIIISVVAVIIVAALGFFALMSLINKPPKDKITNTGGNEQTQQIKEKPQDKNNNTDSQKDNTQNSSVQKEDDKKTDTVTNTSIEAREYLPKPNMKFTFDIKAPDGEDYSLEIVSGKIPGSMVTTVELIPESEAFTQHFMAALDGIYVYPDELQSSEASMWIPFDIKPGREWSTDYGSFKIIKTGEVCDLGFKKFDNCIVVEAKLDAADGAFLNYLAPGLGYIYSKDSASDITTYKLTSMVQISEQEAQEIVKKFSPNALGNNTQ